jgi:serine/threonine protein kinase, bacterial
VKSLDLIRCALSCCVAVALLAGCRGSQPIEPPSFWQTGSQNDEFVKRPPVMPTYKVSGPLLYVASYALTGEPLAIYNANTNNPKPIATISDDIDNSSGVCIDGDGTLYVTNQPGTAGWVSEYALGQTKPLRVITTGINTPAFCAIDASGDLWVTNIGLNNVAEYLKGSTKPHATITKGLTYPDGIAVDHAGNIYVGNPNFFSNGLSNIQVYAPGSKSPSRTITDGVTWPVGIAVDAHDTLYVTNDTISGSIEEYRSGQSKPYRIITDKLVNPVAGLVGKNGWLYVSNAGQHSYQQAILEFPPHSLKPSSRKITNGFFNPQGLAYYPPLLP